ncbi:hypothetical protein PFLUV_G00181260 [Perca fluviatilis]|uniref:Uncharacterized protein n=1 Tax=Perca fluviatilis TaxID=8168 RepID=A0A6A5DX04_PERFL|nr:hypothetical protein PFLUV_G00181260 [Perca fluviatilis]
MHYQSAVTCLLAFWRSDTGVVGCTLSVSTLSWSFLSMQFGTKLFLLKVNCQGLFSFSKITWSQSGTFLELTLS